MNLRLSRSGAAVVLCAAALLTLSACSDDSNDSADSTPSAADSTSAEASAVELDVRVEDLMLPESDFPGTGTYVVKDKAAIDADKSADPDVTPANCAAIANDEDETDAFDRAQVEYDMDDGTSIETEVVLGQADDFDTIVSQVEDCPAMTMRIPSGDGTELVAEMENSIEDVDGSTVPAKTITSTGTMTSGDQVTPLTIRSTGAFVEGTTVSVQITLVGENAGNWSASDEATLVELLNKQIAIVQDAAAA
ncbi:hypothetical protein [Nocardia sp. 348MFTsu5.1]|uniref:hypothetical protein n=1 Tax=Nocardia sp. 348MFTsu5.1 TaxID=1172185 RepID=UPI00055E53C8|nr:hypothetical protein [Nocardia sp. 348MFTsu5.1]